MRAARFTAGRWLALSVGVLAVAALLSVAPRSSPPRA